MDQSHAIFENLSNAIGVGVTALDISGRTRFASSAFNEVSPFLSSLLDILDCTDADRISLLYGCYQSRRFGGRYFSKVFKEETGQTPGSYITAVRIDESKKLLRDSRVSIVDIPELSGFDSQSYFTQVFKKIEGCTPGRYRQRCIESEPTR